MKIKIIFFSLLINLFSYSQVPFPHISTSAGNSSAERISLFSVDGAGNDRLEITNATDYDGQFVPCIWAYRETDNRYTLALTANISASTDNGAIPLMIFSTGIPSALQLNSPTNGDFPWGNAGTMNQVINRPLFQWNNSSNKLMTILANGNLGVGTIFPTAKFHSNGTVRFENLSSSINPNFILGTDTNGNVFKYSASSIGGVSDSDWLKPDGTLPLSINDDIYTYGKVGINIQNPTANLHSNGTVRFENLSISNIPNFILGTDTNGNVFKYSASSVGGVSDSDWLKPDGTLPLSINDDIYTYGKVGINIQNPTANLHSNGTVRFENLSSSLNPNFILGTDTNGNVFKYNSNSVGGVSDSDWLKLDGSISYSINDDIYSNGKVGIGVNILPTKVGVEDVSLYKLYVKGGILTEEVRVALTTEWADYVFKNNYNLPSLAEVENNIKKTGHLQDIPSQKEVIENGIELGKMNKLLLQKIEELTLYLIELNKKVEEQEKQIDFLKNTK